MLVAVGLLVALGVMALFPETATARWLRRALVDIPAGWLARLTPAKALAAFLFVPALLIIMTVAPELLPLIATIGDAGLFLEVLLLVWFASVAGGLRDAWRRVVSIAPATVRLGRFIAPRRAARRKRPARPPARPGDSGDEPAAAWAFA